MSRAASEGSTRARLQARTDHSIVVCTVQTSPVIANLRWQLAPGRFRARSCFHKVLTFRPELPCDDRLQRDSCNEKGGLADPCLCQEPSRALKVRLGPRQRPRTSPRFLPSLTPSVTLTPRQSGLCFEAVWVILAFYARARTWCEIFLIQFSSIGTRRAVEIVRLAPTPRALAACVSRVAPRGSGWAQGMRGAAVRRSAPLSRLRPLPTRPSPRRETRDGPDASAWRGAPTVRHGVHGGDADERVEYVSLSVAERRRRNIKVESHPVTEGAHAGSRGSAFRTGASAAAAGAAVARPPRPPRALTPCAARPRPRRRRARARG
jgi:hypothetical protein